MTLTRRDVLTGAAVVVATGGSVALGSDGQPSPESNLPVPAVPSRAVPSRDEVTAWELRYKARYRAEHRARNAALASMFENEEPEPMRIDLAAAHVEGELAAAEGLVQLDHEGIAKARGDGFAAMRAGQWYDTCPYSEDFDKFMAWHAGYFQAQPQPVDRSANRPRGYRPPQPYACPACKVPEGDWHADDCADWGHKTAPITVRRPLPRPGVTFT